MGCDRELVWSVDDSPDVDHPVPGDADANGCDWPAAVSGVRSASDWRSGFYLVTLTAHDAPPTERTATPRSSCVPADPARAALLVLATNTYNAYNSWGGSSLYTGGKEVSFRPAVRARDV